MQTSVFIQPRADSRTLVMYACKKADVREIIDFEGPRGCRGVPSSASDHLRLLPRDRNQKLHQEFGSRNVDEDGKERKDRKRLLRFSY